jgi:hypothetical protein
MNLWCHKNGINPRLYRAWIEMRRRCRAPRHAKAYSDRHITVCDRWQKFTLFAKDMGPHPGKGWTLERKKNNKGYSKPNCEWASYTAQARNRRNNRLTLAEVCTMRALADRFSQHQLAKRFGVSQPTVWEILHKEIWL